MEAQLQLRSKAAALMHYSNKQRIPCDIYVDLSMQ